MRIAKVLVVCLAAVVLVYFVRRKRPVVIREDTDGKQQSGRGEQIVLRGVRTDGGQMNFHCYGEQDQQVGMLLASYVLRPDYKKEQPGYSVHLEQIHVRRSYRRKGIGKALIAYLIREMCRLEEQEGVAFQKVYGEVGKGGSDDPMLSRPFYEKLHNIPYGTDRCWKLCWKESSAEGLEQFEYHIVKKRT